MIADGAYITEAVSLIYQKCIDLIANEIRSKKDNSDIITSKSYQFTTQGMISKCPKREC